MESCPSTPHSRLRCMPSTRAQGYVLALTPLDQDRQSSAAVESSRLCTQQIVMRNDNGLTDHRKSDHHLLFHHHRDHSPHRPRCYACPSLLPAVGCRCTRAAAHRRGDPFAQATIPNQRNALPTLTALDNLDALEHLQVLRGQTADG